LLSSEQGDAGLAEDVHDALRAYVSGGAFPGAGVAPSYGALAPGGKQARSAQRRDPARSPGSAPRRGRLPGGSTGVKMSHAASSPGRMQFIMVRFQTTPNPNAGKFIVGRPVVEGRASKSFYSAAQAATEPVAAALFELDGVQSIFMVEDFITVTKTADADWGRLVPEVSAVIERTMR
jgi:hypothetical protein